MAGKTSKKTDVKNRDLWIRLDELTENYSVEWCWVRGHSGDKYNELADRLAVEARQNKIRNKSTTKNIDSVDSVVKKIDPVDSTIKIYTGSFCSDNSREWGWGAVLLYGTTQKELQGYESYSTKNRIELTASIAALEYLKKIVAQESPEGSCSVTIYTDSDYVQKRNNGMD